MLKIIRSTLVCWFVAIILSYPVSTSASVQNIRFERLSLIDGLSQESVLSSFQDSEGYMWFGTQEGLNRFDGYQFTVYSYSAERDNTLSSDWVYDIEESEQGLLLFATRSGLNVFEKATQKFTAYRHADDDLTTISDDNIRVLHKDKRNNIWVGTDAGLNRFDVEKGTFTRYPTPADLKPEENSIYAITEDIAGGLWIGTEGGGIYRFDTFSESVTFSASRFAELTGMKDSRIRSLLVDNTQRLWIGTYGNGAYMVSLSQSMDGPLRVSSPPDLTDQVVADIYQSKDNKIWLATDTGLYYRDKDSGNYILIQSDSKNPYSLSGNKISSVFQDRGGVFWVGTYSGLNKWNIATAKFSHYHANDNQTDGLSHNYINTFLDAGDDNIWVGTYEGGLNLFDHQRQHAEHFVKTDDSNSLRSDKVMALFARNKDELWIGYRDKGLSRLNRKTGEFTHYQADPDDPHSLGANGVTSFEKAEGDNFWVGTFNGGLNLYDAKNDRFIQYHHTVNNPRSLSSDKILSITKDSRGYLWVGTWGGGLNLFNPKTKTATRIYHDEKQPNSLGANVIWSVLEDAEHNIWVGTQGGGLNRLSAKNRDNEQFVFERFNRYFGLPSNVVYGILEDSEHHLWLSTNRGLTKFNPQDFTLLNYDSSHGLQGNEFNSGAYYKADNGRFYFGGTNGVTAFYPKDISPNSHVPPVVLTNFQRLNEVESLDTLHRQQGQIEVSHSDYLIAFEFAGLDYASPSNNKYAYKLEGFDRDWIEARDIRKATYTNLPAGQYIFKVKASNNDGVWNEQGANVALTVLAAPWYSWWAYTLYSLLVLTIIFWLYRSYKARLVKEANYRHELEMEVEKRTAELSEVNEQLLNASITDQLTGLHNRRYLASIIEQRASEVFRAFEKARAKGKTSAKIGPRMFFLMFDLDGFKPINDNYGHDAGDKVIAQVGAMLKSVSRAADTVIRWGGDEFLVIGQVDEQEEVEILADRLRRNIAEHGFDIGLKQKMHLSSSIGFSCYPFSHFCPDALSWEQVHVIADSALYMSKEAGKNCWTGLLQANNETPPSVMNTLTQNLPRAIANNYIECLQSGTKSNSQPSESEVMS